MTLEVLTQILSKMLVILALMSQMITAQPSLKLGADNNLPAGLSTYNIAGTGLSSSATSINLASLTIPQSGQELLDADFSDTFYLTLEPGSRSRQEFVSCTTVTPGAGTLSTLSGCLRGLSPISPFTASTTLQFAHSGGSQVIFSNSPQFYNRFASKDNDETISGTWTFSSTSPPTYDANITASGNQFVSFGQLNSVAIAGAGTSTETALGLVELATRTEQAASTASSTTGAPLVLLSREGDATYDGSKTNQTVITGATNVIDANYIATSSVYHWTGNHDFTASTTFATATTTFGGGVTFNKIVDGNMSRLLLATTTNVSIGTASTTVFSTTIPANVLYNNAGSNGVVKTRINFSAFSVGVNDTWRIEALYGGISVCCMATTTVSPLQAIGGTGYVDVDLYGSNASNAQEVFINPSIVVQASTDNASGGPFPFLMTAKTGSLSVDSTIPQTLEIRAKTVAGNTNTVSQISSFLMR